MFGLAEVRLMLYSMRKTAENLEAKLKILGPESEDRIGIGNDLMLCSIVLALRSCASWRQSTSTRPGRNRCRIDCTPVGGEAAAVEASRGHASLQSCE